MQTAHNSRMASNHSRLTRSIIVVSWQLWIHLEQSSNKIFKFLVTMAVFLAVLWSDINQIQFVANYSELLNGNDKCLKCEQSNFYWRFTQWLATYSTRFKLRWLRTEKVVLIVSTQWILDSVLCLCCSWMQSVDLSRSGFNCLKYTGLAIGPFSVDCWNSLYFISLKLQWIAHVTTRLPAEYATWIDLAQNTPST